MAALGAGLITGLIGTAVGIDLVFCVLILGVAISTSLKRQLFSYAIVVFAEATGLFALILAFLFIDLV